MAAIDRHAHRRRRHREVRLAEDLARLVDHLHFLFRVEVVEEDVNLRDGI